MLVVLVVLLNFRGKTLPFIAISVEGVLAHDKLIHMWEELAALAHDFDQSIFMRCFFADRTLPTETNHEFHAS